MKVLILTDGITPFVIGGMQKHSYMLAKYLAREGVQVELHHCIYSAEELTDASTIFTALENKNIISFAYHFPKKGKVPGHYVRNSYAYSKVLFDAVKDRLSEFDFIYTKGFTGWKLLEEKEKGMSMPRVGVKFHGYEMFQPSSDINAFLKGKLLQSPTIKLNRLADVVFSYGGKITGLIEGIGVDKKKICQIPGAIEEEFIRKEITRTGEKIKFVFLGRYERRKGIQELHQALEALLKTCQNFEFHLIGPIPEKKQIISSQITYHGELKAKNEIFNILDQCDVLVCPSHSEGMPNVILEGMARGLAILATDVGATSLLVRNLENGILAKRADSDLVYNALLSFTQLSPSVLDEYKSTSLSIVNEFKWESVSELLIKALGEPQT